MSCNIRNRTIFCKDNLDILQGINDNCIDLIYLDPPFNKKKTFTAPIGSSAEGASFSDIFREEDVKEEWLQTIEEDYEKLHAFLEGVKTTEGKKSYNFCYLAYMAIRLIEMYRILKDTGSIYLHCDQTMSHYLKILMDCIFGEKNFRNEVVWAYHGPGAPKQKQFSRKHDTLFWYAKSNVWCFNSEDVRLPYKEKKQTLRRRMSPHGRITQEEEDMYHARGKIPEDWWEVRVAARSKKEYVGYPTQKPLALLERIIKAGSNEGDIVLDPFCGCATTCVAAEKLGRQWIGIDVSVQAYELVKKRLRKEVEEKRDLFDPEKDVGYYTDPPKRTDRDADYREQKYVYIVSHPNYPDEYKVGIAKNRKSRLNSYQTGDPDRAYKMEFHYLTPYFREIEQHIHERFENKREWVQAELSDIREAIENYKPKL